MTEQIEVELTGMVYGGYAIGRADGRTLFVTGGLPGERVSARITRDQVRYAFAVVEQVIVPSPQRITPRCVHFRAKACGGCQWQHLDYEAQLAYKTEIVGEQFRRIGKFTNAPILPILASPDPWFYRTHVTFQVEPVSGRLGFVAPDDRTLIPIDECHILRPELMEMRQALDSGAGIRQPGHRRLRCMVGSDGSERVSVSFRPDEADEDASANMPGGSVTFAIKDQTFRVGAGSFFQVNLLQAEHLVDLVLEHLRLSGHERVLDLYSGVGLFTAFLAKRAAQVSAIESSPGAVADARVNLARFPKVEVREGLVEVVLPRFSGRFDSAVIDPPRAGMQRKALEALVAKRPRRIAYVSCDPTTLARDARRLVDAGYTLAHVRPLDMFPQTYHIECVAGFERRAAA
ncbi:MAG: class I SAM-dependent RNA methyltransferase [Anaerolineae bacterium]|nr:class I SAM-dependent RNA methyltransferase [Anaerolineae bacterium]NUQ02399.1 class I SAM-dependent RNA methyltransferase [Anaerolineae bacterium]